MGEFQGKLNGPKNAQWASKLGSGGGGLGDPPDPYLRSMCAFINFCTDFNLIIAHRNFRQVKKSIKVW